MQIRYRYRYRYPEGTDEDGDGFTVEEGDCDDNDIGVNPAREEDPSDGKDNDSDGRVDEEWSGLIASLQSESGNSSIVHLIPSVALPMRWS